MSLKDRLKRWLPEPDHIKEDRRFKILGELMHDPNIWHINRNSVSGAVAIGFACAWMPLPGQMLIAALMAIYFRKNLPLAAFSTWVTNPLTLGPAFYFAYWLGAQFLDSPAGGLEVKLSLDWVFTELGARWRPFFLGCLIMGSFSSIAGYFGSRWLWRYHVVNKMKKRRIERRQARLQRERLKKDSDGD